MNLLSGQAGPSSLGGEHQVPQGKPRDSSQSALGMGGSSQGTKSGMLADACAGRSSNNVVDVELHRTPARLQMGDQVVGLEVPIRCGMVRGTLLLPLLLLMRTLGSPRRMAIIVLEDGQLVTGTAL